MEKDRESPSQPLSNEVALRIGLAARELPAIEVDELVQALRDAVGPTLDEASLSRVTVTNLKSAFLQSHDVDGDEDREDFRTAKMEAFKDAVRILWGDTTGKSEGPVCEEPLGDEEGPHVRVAVASNRDEKLDGHFGSCARFLIYDVSATKTRLVDIRSTVGADLTSDRNGFRVGLISKDCRVVYVVSVGGPASAKVIKADVHIVAVPEGGEAREILTRLQGVVAGTPPPWLAKALGVQAGLRVKNYKSSV